MRDLIRTPDSPAQGFLKGFVSTAAALGIPLVITLLFRAGPKSLAYSLLVTLAASLVAGVWMALWRLVQRWAYDRHFGGPDF